MVNYFAPIQLNFVVPGTLVPTVTTRVGAWNDPTGSIIRLAVYNSADSLLESVQANQGYFLGITRPGIARAMFSFVSMQSQPGFSLEDVTFGSIPTAVEPMPLAAGLWMATPRPNPSRGGSVAFSFGIKRDDTVELSLYDLGGRRVARRAQTRFAAGPHTLMWNSGVRSPGLYFARLLTGDGQMAEQRWVVLK